MIKKSCEYFDEFYLPKLQNFGEFALENAKFCNLCSLCKYQNIAASLHKEGGDFAMRQNALKLAAKSKSYEKLLPYSRVAILTNNYINPKEFNFLAKSLQEIAALDINSASIIYSAHCAASASASEREICAGFLLSKLADCGAKTVLCCGEDAASALFDQLRALSIRKAKLQSKIVKFVINYGLFDCLAEPEKMHLFKKYLRNLRT